MRRDELQRLIQGAICSLPTPFDEDFRVDNGRMYELVQWLVDQGVVTGSSVLKVASVGGEGLLLADDEWPALLRTVVQAADGKAPVMCGISHKDTFRTIRDARVAQDLGAVALQIPPPIFSHPTQDDMVRHSGAVSDAIEIGVMIYNTPWHSMVMAQRYGGGQRSLGHIYPDTFLRMADFEHIVAVQWAVPDDVEYEEMSRFSHIFNVLDNNTDPVLCHKLGRRGYINTHIDLYPPHDLRIWELLESKRYQEAEELYNSVMTPERAAFSARIAKRSGGPGVKKAMMAVMGQPVGPPRPPSLPLSDREVDELREIVKGFGWPVPEPARETAVAVCRSHLLTVRARHGQSQALLNPHNRAAAANV